MLAPTAARRCRAFFRWFFVKDKKKFVAGMQSSRRQPGSSA